MLACAPPPIASLSLSPATPIDEDADAQSCRAFLRLRALDFWRSVRGCDVEFTFVNSPITAHGTFAGVDAHGKVYCVEALTTPLGVVDAALVRASDVMSMSVRVRADGGHSNDDAVTIESDDDGGEIEGEIEDARSASAESESWLADA